MDEALARPPPWHRSRSRIESRRPTVWRVKRRPDHPRGDGRSAATPHRPMMPSTEDSNEVRKLTIMGIPSFQIS